MRKIKLLSVLLMLGQWALAQETEEGPKLEVNGYVRNYIGILLESPNDFNIIQNTINLELKRQDDKIGFYTNPYVYQYSEDKLNIGIRELYLDFFFDKFDIRVGKQQIIWGQADGVFITDIVSPKDLSEFLLRDFNEIRVGVTSIKLNYYINDIHSLEMVVIPRFQATILPEIGSIWRPAMTFSVPVQFDYSRKDIPLRLENTEIFARYSVNAAVIDLQVIGGYTWDDDPSFHISKIIDPGTMTLKELSIQPQHHRLGLAGISFNTDILGFILRGEGAYYMGKYFQTKDPLVKDALVKKDYINYVLGLDRTIGDWRLSSQFIQKIIVKHNDYMETDNVDNLVTLLVSKSMFREKVRIEWFSYVGMNEGDVFSRLRAFYFPYDAVSIELGANLFLGEEGLFGQYDKNDMVYTRVKYNF